MLPRRLLLGVFLLVAAALLPAQENRTALIIGNGAYSHFPRLNQPAGEARRMGDALRRLGFDVTLLLDGTEDEMYGALADFEYKLKSRGGLAFFHFGGHGVQVDGANYLIPVDADIPDERRVKSRALDVDEILGLMEASGSDTNVIILDACRDNPLPGGSRSASRGLAAVRRPPPDSIIVYAADAGDTARDGLFTPTLLKYIETPGAEFGDILRDVRREVLEASGGRQRTGEYNQLISEIYLAGRGGGSRPAPAPAAPTRVERPDGGEGMVFVAGGTFLMGSNDGEEHERPVHRVTVSDFRIGEHEVTQAEWLEVMGTTVRQQRDKGNPDWTLNGEGPDFPMYYVSWEEMVEYCNALSRREGLNPCYNKNGRSIDCDFEANGYRLPTEAEWEFAARGGTLGGDTEYAGGESLDSSAWYAGNSAGGAHPVGRKNPNALGLYDMSGNVAEWCWDLYGEYPSGSQRDPVGAPSGSVRVYRGGGWNSSPSYCRLSSRNKFFAQSARTGDLGFRVVRRP